MIKVSIIVPSKNVEKYIGKCLDSLITQTLYDIEILCVDAHSTDGTREIIDTYRQKDHRIVLMDDDQGSSGYADNLGFKYAHGEYVGIVESDDFIPANMMDCLYQKAKESDLDYIKSDCSMFVEMEEGIVTIDRIQPIDKLGIYDKIINPSDFPELLELDGYMWKGIYKKAFIEKYDIRLNETKGAAYQDNGFLHETICLASRVMYIKDSFYCYRRDNENSSDYNPNGLRMMLEEYRFIADFMKKNKDRTETFKYFYFFKMYQQFRGQFEKALRSQKDFADIQDVVDQFKTLFLQGITEGYVRQCEFGMTLDEIYMLCKDENLYVRYMQFLIESRERRYTEFFKRIMGEKSIVIVCYGSRGQSLYCWLVRNGCENIAAICDNNKELWDTVHFNHKVVSIESACERHKEAYYIVANDVHYTQLTKQLLDCGISARQIEHLNLNMGPHLSTIHSIR